MKVWVVAGDAPTQTATQPTERPSVADQVAALRSAGHQVSFIEAGAPSLRPMAEGAPPAVRGVLVRGDARRAATALPPADRRALAGSGSGTDPDEDPTPAEIDAAIKQVLRAEGANKPDGLVERVQALAGAVGRGLLGAGRVTHDAAGNTVAVARMVAEMIGLMRRDGLPDVVHAHNVFPAGIAATQFGPARGVPVVVTEHAAAYLEGRYAPVELAAAIRVLDRAAAVVAVSAVQAQALPIPTDRITVVPNALPVSDFRLRDAAARDAGTVLCVGRLTPDKRMDVVMRCYAALPPEVRERHPLRILGGGPQRERLARLAVELRLDPGVLRGGVSRAEVADELAGAAVLVSAGTVEAFPMALIEGLVAGVPFVATDSGGPRDIVGPGLGRLVGPDARAALTSAIASTLEQPGDEAADLARRRQAVARFGPEAVAQALTDVYTSVRDGRA